MPAQDLARQWFIPGDGIDRHVISADIQRYLGNDATVRPGRGTGENQGVEGYWIRAYRNLTSAMIADLRADSSRWRQEQRTTGTREPYVGSRTYEQGNASRSQRSNADSPSVEGQYGAPPTSRSSGRGNVDAMQIDPPPVQTDRSRYGQPAQPSRGYQLDSGAYPPQAGRERYGEPGRPPYSGDQSMTDAYGRVPVSTPYGASDPRYGSNYPQAHDGAPPGYVRQGEYYVPITSGGYGQPSVMAPSRPDPQIYASNPYGQPPEPQRDTRDHRGDARDPRYGQPEYNEASRYYPSPATTAASVDTRNPPISSPPVASSYGSIPPQYDQYGRPVQNPSTPYGQEPPQYPPARDPNYGRPPAPPSTSDRDRDARRRRLH